MAQTENDLVDQATTPQVSQLLAEEDVQISEETGGKEAALESEASANAMRQLLALKDRLTSDSAKLVRRFWMMSLFFLVGLILLGGVLKTIHYFFVGRYAVLEKVVISQNPGNQGQLEISYRVVQPGRVHCRRTSGTLQTDLIFDYYKTGEDQRHWNWNYVPGESIDVTLWSRDGLLSVYQPFHFTTSNVVDIVILMDTTESMDSSIQALKEECVTFASQLKEQALKPRFLLIGFGDATLGKSWASATEFTDDVQKFQESVSTIQRFEGGDLPESALDVLAMAMEKVKQESKGHVIRFYLVTDQTFHPQTNNGVWTATTLAKSLRENGIMLEVFCHPQFQADFEPLIGDCGHFREIENFGEILAQGRFLED